MEALWRAGAAQTVADVQTSLEAPGRAVSYSAIKTVLNNLHAKGHLDKGVLGRSTIFRTRLDRSAFEATVVRNLVGSIRRQYGQGALLQFVEEVAAEEDGLERLEAMVAQRRAERDAEARFVTPRKPASKPRK